MARRMNKERGAGRGGWGGVWGGGGGGVGGVIVTHVASAEVCRSEHLQYARKHTHPTSPFHLLISRSTLPAYRKRPFRVDGSKFGSGTNIFSVYADPELASTWEQYNLRNARLVVSCMLRRSLRREFLEEHSSRAFT